MLGGIYVYGGPPPFPCVGTPAPTPAEDGTIQVLDASGNVVGMQTVAAGQTFSIPLPPGTYTARASTPSVTFIIAGVAAPWSCGSDGPFTVTAGNQAVVQLVCNIA